MAIDEKSKKASKSSARKRADAVKPYHCKNLIAVLENPSDMVNIGAVIRNVDALGVDNDLCRRSAPCVAR